MHIKLALTSALILSLTACHFPAYDLIKLQQQDVQRTTIPLGFDEKTQARVRVYYTLANIVNFNNTTCEDWSKTKTKNYFTRVANSVPNHEIIRIGMPTTATSAEIFNKKQGWGNKETFKEFIVTANQSMIIDATMVDNIATYRSCHIAASFIPQAGQNYEVWYSQDQNMCTLKFNTINDDAKADIHTTQPFNNIKVCH